MRVLERWFTELCVAWVLHLTEDGASASAGTGKELDHHGFDDDDNNDARSWFRGLAEIMKTINHTWSSFSEDGASVGLPVGTKTPILDLFQFAQFIQVVMAKMIAFVDVVVPSSATNNTTAQVLLTTGSGLVLPCEKISALLGVHGALRRVNIRLSELASPSAKVETIKAQIINLLSPKDVKTGEAVWSIVEQIRTELTEDSCDWSSSLTLQGSPDIHEATRSIIRYIIVLRSHRSSMALIIPTEANRPQVGDMPLLDSMMEEIASCLVEKLAGRSESFPDQSLRSLFLLNNAYFIRRQLSNRDHPPRVHVAGLNNKINDYFMSYLQMSWEPVLPCLLNPNQLLFGENYTPLFMFESEFQKTCTAQKQWKVPDPKLRKNMRRAIVWKIVPDYAKYIEQNQVTTPKFSPGELEEMLQELFEE
ncbi:hypothetical protein BS78_05G258300 [Paspalum vaginatum]|nr:hypothetical protein BS78_05G258300 [Paspalum vaginatum]